MKPSSWPKGSMILTFHTRRSRWLFIFGHLSDWTTCCIANRNGSLPLFSPVSSSSDRANGQLQTYPKTYSQQQVFSQQQGSDGFTRQPRLSVQGTLPVLVLFWTLIISSVVFQGCVYREGKVQPVSDGGFEPASYFTNPTSSPSAGKTAMRKSTAWARQRSLDHNDTPLAIGGVVSYSPD